MARKCRRVGPRVAKSLVFGGGEVVFSAGVSIVRRPPGENGEMGCCGRGALGAMRR